MTKRTSYKFNPFDLLDIDVPRDKKNAALKEAAEFVRDSILDFVAQGKSPVKGFSDFKGLTTEYKAQKRKLGGAPKPNLELEGDLLAALEAHVSGNQIEVGIFDSSQNGKAEGNNLGTYGTDSEFKPRRFIPVKDRGETFKQDIMNGIRDILDDYSED